MAIDFDAAGDGVYVITLNRPERLNALDSAHKQRLAEIWRSAEEKPEVRAIVVRGAGAKAFSAGSDFKDMKESGRTVSTEVLANAIPTVGIEFTKPAIAALHGHVIGFGLTLAIHCDLRVAAPDARLSFPEVAHGMLSGISDLTLPGIVGEAAALEIMLTGRTYTAHEAREMRLVNKIVDDPFAEAMSIAKAMAANSLSATRLTKRLLLSGRRASLLKHMAEIADARDAISRSKRHAAIISGDAPTGKSRQD